MTETESDYHHDRLYEEVRRIVVARATEEWRDDAACRGVGPGRFFSDRGDSESVEAAKALCDSCPVARECFDYAATERIRFGIWGGSGATKVKALSSSYPRRVEPCRECGRDFTPGGQTNLFCSRDCYDTRRRRRRAEADAS